MGGHFGRYRSVGTFHSPRNCPSEDLEIEWRTNQRKSIAVIEVPWFRSQTAEAMVSGLRVAYLGGALVELAGAMIPLVFIRSDSMEQRKG